jgi:ADP-ribose pyrophosphatase YjhB (NUDIX family)
MNNYINPNGANMIFWRTRENGSIEVLLQKSATRERNSWKLPGGGLEYDQGETFLDAAVRETTEEIGLVPEIALAKIVAVLQQRKRVPEIPDKYVIGTVTVFAALVHTIDLDSLSLQPEEVSDVRWWPIEEALRAGDGVTEEWVSLACRRMLAHCFNYLQSFEPEIYNGDLIREVRVITNQGEHLTI